MRVFEFPDSLATNEFFSPERNPWRDDKLQQPELATSPKADGWEGWAEHVQPIQPTQIIVEQITTTNNCTRKSLVTAVTVKRTPRAPAPVRAAKPISEAMPASYLGSHSARVVSSACTPASNPRFCSFAVNKRVLNRAAMPPVRTQFETEAQAGWGIGRPTPPTSRAYMQSQSGQLPCLSAAGFNVSRSRTWRAVPGRSTAPGHKLVELTPISGTAALGAEHGAWGGFTDRLGQFSCRPTAYAHWDAPYSDRTHGCESRGKPDEPPPLAKPQTADSGAARVSIFARYSTVLIRRLHTKLRKAAEVRFESDWGRLGRMMDKSGDQRLNVAELAALCFDLFEAPHTHAHKRPRACARTHAHTAHACTHVHARTHRTRTHSHTRMHARARAQVGRDEFPLEVVAHLFSLLDKRSAHRSALSTHLVPLCHLTVPSTGAVTI
jgi:hypothetical protein